MKKGKGFETIEIEDGSLVVTRQEHISLKNTEAIADIEKLLEKELAIIINQIKGLKTEAQKKKDLLVRIRREKNVGSY